jgi:hypothetical protein
MDLQFFADKVKDLMSNADEGDEYEMDYDGSRFTVKGTIRGALATLHGGNVELIIAFDRTVKITEPWFEFYSACSYRDYGDGRTYKCHHPQGGGGKCDRKRCPRLGRS